MGTKNRSKVAFWGIVTVIFLILLGCNWLTLYISDDFSYAYSFDDGTRIAGIGDIVKSMAAHTQKMNGRIVAHTFVQFFSMFPNVVFDVVNASIFTVFIYMVYLLGMGKFYSNWNCFILLGVFAAVWLYMPVFSEIVLWQDGACNYLWAIAFGLIWIKPFVDGFAFDRQINSKRGKLLLWICSFLVGAYTECVSAACICMGILFVLLINVWQKKKGYRYLLVSLILASLGYLTIYLAPAQWANKAGSMDFLNLCASAVTATLMYRNFGILWILFVVLLTLNILEKTELKTIILAAVFVIGSLAANYIMIFASGYAERASGGAFAFLLVADVMLLCALWHNKKYKASAACILAVATLLLIPALAEAARDITYTYIEMRSNERYILGCKENGIMDITVPIVTGTKTKYSVGWRPDKYLREDPQHYKNKGMARYYGVDTIIGTYQK